jgi:hypothetical protein
MQDLNDLYYFASVVDHGGFAAAGRALGLQKSKLSRRIRQVEERLGVRLLNRSSRRFSVIEIGRELFTRTVLVAAALKVVVMALSLFIPKIRCDHWAGPSDNDRRPAYVRHFRDLLDSTVALSIIRQT